MILALNEQKSRRTIVFIVYLSLAVITYIAFEQLRLNNFIDFDDVDYLTKNTNVQKGLTADSVLWAFKSGYQANWHPLTWLSHMADCQLYELNPTGHHLTNLALHILSTLLLFCVLKSMTRAVWPSAFVAALFAIHPLHVESVAWAAERKDVLSGLFCMLTIAAYIRYTRRPCVTRYLLVFISLSLGLMAKPMLVTMPFVLLLLDYWPLERFQQQPREKTGRTTAYNLVAEKIPLIVLVVISSIVTYHVQRSGGGCMGY